MTPAPAEEAPPAPGGSRRAAAAIVVPGGLGRLFLERALPPGDAELMAGAERGEAGVDFLLVGETTVETFCGGGGKPFPAIGVLALVARCAASLEALTDAVQHSERWPSALDLRRAWRGGAAVPATFRATALREDGLADPPSTNGVARSCAAGVHRRFGWAAHMTEYDVEVCALWLGAGVLVGLPLTPGWHASGGKKGFFMNEELSYACPASADPRRSSSPVLRSSVCHGLLLRAGLEPGDVLLDPMAGVGSVPAEALGRFGCAFALGGDSGRSAVRQARRITARGCAGALDVACWDARRLPLRSGSVDKIVTDMPWGKRCKSEPALLLESLREFARVLRLGGLAVVLLLRAAAKTIGRLDCGLDLVETIGVVVGGWPVAVAVLRKDRAADADGADGAPVARPAAAAHAAPWSNCCAAVVVTDRLSALGTAEALVEVWPQLAPTISAARRAIRHRRVCIASAPETQLWWRVPAPLGERIVLRPHLSRYQPYDEPLAVLWETEEWVCVLKPPGMAVLRGRRSLANALLALQASRRGPEGAAPPEPPWSVAFDGEARVGGAWLGAKTALAALSLLDRAASVRLCWTCILRGSPSARVLARLGCGDASVGRVGRSVRYASICEVSFSGGADCVEWRSEINAAGHPVVGDRPFCDGPSACLWITAAHVDAGAAARGGTAEAAHHGAGEPPRGAAAVPERFAKQFEREEAVHKLADEGALTSAYALSMLAKLEAEQRLEAEAVAEAADGDADGPAHGASLSDDDSEEGAEI